MSSIASASMLGSTRGIDGMGSEDNTLSFNDSDFYLNMDDVDIGPQIGQGAFSKVYLGRYLGELVAVKKQARREADLEAYLMRELAVLKHFQHENLLQYVGASNAAAAEPGGLGHVFIVTELACGGDLLAMLLSEKEVGWKLRVSILTDAARALEFLHRKSLIHRDIKSPNILLDSQHRCKIADFGMARQLGSNMTVVGTDAYMAPELMYGNPYGTSADMFSFGIVLWETIYRQKAGTEDFMERRMSDNFDLDVQGLQDDAPPDTSASLVALAAQLVENEPDQRPTAEDTLLWLEDLTDALPDDEEEPWSPIDYESLFPLEMGERENQRLAHAREMSSRAKATAISLGNVSALSGSVFSAPALKAYSPELMVTPVYSSDELTDRSERKDELVQAVTSLFPKLHSLLLGPGLGRNPVVLAAAAEMVRGARARGLPVVLDADSLAMVADSPETVRGFPLAVLTPNANEFRILCERMERDTAAAACSGAGAGAGGAAGGAGGDDEEPGGRVAAATATEDEKKAVAVERLARYLGGVTVVSKGRVDIVSDGVRTVACAVPGGLKRCGGIGDVLAGAMGTSLAWVYIQKLEGGGEEAAQEAREQRLWAAWWACALTRHASRRAYEAKGRAMSATDVFEHLGGVLEEVAPSPAVED